MLALAAVVAALTLLVGCASAAPVSNLDPSVSVLHPSSPRGSAGAPSAFARSASAPSASASPAPSTAPTVTVSPSLASSSPLPVAELGADRIGIVVTDGLRVRSRPGVNEQSELLEPTLGEGVRFYVVDGPVIADGYAWYQGQPYHDPSGADAARPPLPFGWVAAGGRDGEPWIEPLRLSCDGVPPTPEDLAIGEPLEHLYCGLGGEDVTVEGRLVCGLGDVDFWTSGPGWVHDHNCHFRTEAGSYTLFGAVTALLGDGPDALFEHGPVDGRHTVWGHFDDPGARECVDGGPDGEDAAEGYEPPDPAQVRLTCRTWFVVTRVTPLR